MNNPLISVLIPSYNHENYVQETINSIINQTYQNIEIIVVDDGSTDYTWQKIQEMRGKCETRFQNVHFETKENEGTCKTFNKLLDLARGEYIYIIASDDLAKPTAIEQELEFLKSNQDYALCVGNNEIVDSDGKICYWDEERNIVYDVSKAKYKTFTEFLEPSQKFKFTSDKFGTYESISHSNYVPNGYLIRKKSLDNFRFTPDAPLEDWNLMLHISKYYKMKYINEVLFSYRWHASNTIKNQSKMDMYTKKTREFEEQILEQLNDNDLPKDVLRVKKYGACYKKQGIPFLFQILSYKKSDSKLKMFKVFGITVYKHKKA